MREGKNQGRIWPFLNTVFKAHPLQFFKSYKTVKVVTWHSDLIKVRWPWCTGIHYCSVFPLKWQGFASLYKSFQNIIVPKVLSIIMNKAYSTFGNGIILISPGNSPHPKVSIWISLASLRIWLRNYWLLPAKLLCFMNNEQDCYWFEDFDASLIDFFAGSERQSNS